MLIYSPVYVQYSVSSSVSTMRKLLSFNKTKTENLMILIILSYFLYVEHLQIFFRLKLTLTRTLTKISSA